MGDKHAFEEHDVDLFDPENKASYEALVDALGMRSPSEEEDHGEPEPPEHAVAVAPIVDTPESVESYIKAGPYGVFRLTPKKG